MDELVSILRNISTRVDEIAQAQARPDVVPELIGREDLDRLMGIGVDTLDRLDALGPASIRELCGRKLWRLAEVKEC